MSETLVIRNLEQELIRLGLDPAQIRGMKSAIVRPESFSWHVDIPGTDYMFFVRYETHFIRCAGQSASHFNVQLRNKKTNQDVFNLHIGAGRSRSSGRITVFTFDSASNWELCQEVPSVNDLKAKIESFLKHFCEAAGIVLPAVVLAAIAVSLAYLIVLMGLAAFA